MKLPRVTGNEIVRALHKAGYVDDHQRGSHLTLRHKQTGKRVVVPVHAGKVIKPKTLKSILRSANLSVAVFANLLRDP
ncbi:MAG: type II toxin-antitoxin system HicA family toxin [Armatimonadota bacterium]